MTEKEVKLYIGAPKGITPPIRISQHDTEWRFVFTIYNGDDVWHPNDVVSVAMMGVKPDGNAFLFNGKITGTNYTVDCARQMTSAAGEIECELRFSNEDGKLVSTANFTLAIEKAPFTGYMLSKSDFNGFDQLINQAMGLIATTNKIATIPETKEYFNLL